MSDAAQTQVMREFYAQPFTEPDGSRTWCVREYVYGPDIYSRQIISWHPTREEAQEEVERRYGR